MSIQAKRLIWIALAVVLVILLAMWFNRQDQSEEAKLDRLKLRAHEKLAYRLMDDAYMEKLKQERPGQIEELIAIVEDDGIVKRFHAIWPHIWNVSNVRVRAVELLGEYRAAKAVEALIANIITISPPFSPSPSGDYPCVGALIKIGKPSTSFVVAELRKPMNKLRFIMLLQVLAVVESRAVGRQLLEREMASAMTPEERENLEQAMTDIQSAWYGKE